MSASIRKTNAQQKLRELRELNGLLSEHHEAHKPSLNEIYGARMVLADGPLVPRTTQQKHAPTVSRITGDFDGKVHGSLKLSAETPHLGKSKVADLTRDRLDTLDSAIADAKFDDFMAELSGNERRFLMSDNKFKKNLQDMRLLSEKNEIARQ